MAITAGNDILASDFVSTSAGAGDSGKVPKLNASGVLDVSFLQQPMVNTLNVGTTITGVEPVYMGPYQSDGGILLDTSGNANSNSFSITIGGNTNRMLVVFVQLPSGTGSITGVTFNGVAMTQIDTQNGGTNGNGAFAGKSFILPAPATTAHTLAVTVSAGTAQVTYYSIYNCSQSTTPDAHTATIRANSGAETAITTVANGALVFGAIFGSNVTITGAATFENHLTAGSNAINSYDSSCVFPAGTSVGIGSNSSDPLVSFGEMLLSIAPITAPTYAVSPASSANSTNQYWNKYSSFVGFSTASASAGTTAPITVGGIVAGLSSLTPWKNYYLADSAGTIGITAGTNTRKIGIAITSTTLLITNIW